MERPRGKYVAVCRGGRWSGGAWWARALVGGSVAGLLMCGCGSGGKCVAACRGKAFRWCVAGAGACGLERGRFRHMLWGARLCGACRAWVLMDQSATCLGRRVSESGAKCVAACCDEADRRCARSDVGRKTSLHDIRTPSLPIDRKEANSSDGMRWWLPVTVKPVPVACGVGHAFGSRDAARHKTRINQPANMSPHVAATHIRAAHDTFHPRATATCLHATASPTALPRAACPRSTRPAHAFVVLRNGTSRVTPRHLL
ncbi:hypothetical protein BLA39750_07568 [Burkholderia lata]|uniref:Uncharacterized protein n=1 Tax=Burkholderia lata (strain ATCC 17760 / DSM 23089 / LMG 22485 / NCIMB 9086 / R18194 / 383) TaxID=482957 RepID=A0A6P3BUJ0_BURL3|nr:hypothetical protein BLA39750_07568 [Burkholderia lata]